MPEAVKTKSKKATKRSTSATTTMISAWEHDPASGNSPVGGRIFQQPVPNLNATSLPTVITIPTKIPKISKINLDKVPEAKVYNPGTDEFKYWNTAAALNRGSEFWSKLLPGMSWQAGKTLSINLDAGVDLNAYYNRKSLTFFHASAGNRTVFTCESPDVVCHEQGHAVLDALKPQLWNVASIEADAFHESFGDISAILSALQIQTVRFGVIAETEGVLYRSSSLSRIAEQLGWAIRQKYPTSAEADCLRNAVNSFFYQDPNTLPSNAPATSLSSQSHSFSRVFTAAFFEGLAGMFKLRQDQDESNLLQVSQDIGQILVEGVRAAAVVPTFFSQVAVNMIRVANSKFPELAYSDALKSAFVRHGIISPASVTAFASRAAFKAMEAVADHEHEDELPKLSLTVAEYDLGVDNIIVYAASEAKRFDVAGAALAIGSVVPPSQDEAAKSFVEELLRRGRLKGLPNKDNKGFFGVSRASKPETHDTHTHELSLEDGHYVLRRIRIACSFHS